MEAVSQIIIALLTIVTGLIAYIGHGAIKRMDEHLRTCGERNHETDKSEAVSEERLNSLTWEIKQIRTTNHWFGDCLQVLGAKMDVRMPPRPTTE